LVHGAVAGWNTTSPHAGVTLTAATLASRFPVAASNTRMAFFSGCASRRHQGKWTQTASAGPLTPTTARWPPNSAGQAAPGSTIDSEIVVSPAAAETIISKIIHCMIGLRKCPVWDRCLGRSRCPYQ
jgi:hypothetical protein